MCETLSCLNKENWRDMLLASERREYQYISREAMVLIFNSTVSREIWDKFHSC